MKRLLITGARGFVGRHCLGPAIEQGFETHAVSSSAETESAGQGLDVTWHQADLLHPDAAAALIAKIRPSHILHMAWETGHGSYWTDPANLQWLEFGSRLARLFAAAGGERFVTAGTCAEYDWSHGYMTEAVTPEQPATFYGRIKLQHHEMLMAAGRSLGFSAATGRIFFGYGPFENSKRVIPHACCSLLRRQDGRFSSGDFYRDFMHVSDIGTGFIALLQSDITGACNVSSGRPSRLADLIATIGGISGRPELVHLGATPDRPDDPPMLVGDNRRLRTTGWAPKITIEDGLRQTYDWWRRHLSA